MDGGGKEAESNIEKEGRTGLQSGLRRNVPSETGRNPGQRGVPEAEQPSFL